MFVISGSVNASHRIERGRISDWRCGSFNNIAKSAHVYGAQSNESDQCLIVELLFLIIPNVYCELRLHRVPGIDSVMLPMICRM